MKCSKGAYTYCIELGLDFKSWLRGWKRFTFIQVGAELYICVCFAGCERVTISGIRQAVAESHTRDGKDKENPGRR